MIRFQSVSVIEDVDDEYRVCRLAGSVRGCRWAAGK